MVFTLAGLVLVGLTAELDEGEAGVDVVVAGVRLCKVVVFGAGVAVGLEDGRVEVNEGDDSPACGRVAA